MDNIFQTNMPASLCVSQLWGLWQLCCVHWIVENHTLVKRSLIIQWRHNGRDDDSNHQPHEYLLKRLLRHRSEKTSKLLVTGLVKGIHRWPVNSPHKGPVTPKMFSFDDVSWCVLTHHCANIAQSGHSSILSKCQLNTDKSLVLTTVG